MNLAYYNDNDPRACAWLRELIAAGELPAGDVDCRSILEVKADELAKYDQCHWFAGIGGWPLALRWAGLEGVAGIWTGSCPCQPLSCAGKRQGHADERHLWPAFHGLIAKCRPAIVLGEQVASADGREWFAGVRADLEELGYACGGADLCAAGVGAPHRRQRLYWVADLLGAGLERGNKGTMGNQQSAIERSGGSGVLADAEHDGGRADEPGREAQGRGADGRAGWLGDASGRGCGVGVDAPQPGRGGHADRAGWARFDILPCRDGKARRVESGTFPLAHGIPGRMGLLRGYGNAIVPPLAAEFIKAAVEAMDGTALLPA